MEGGIVDSEFSIKVKLYKRNLIVIKNIIHWQQSWDFF